MLKHGEKVFNHVRVSTLYLGPKHGRLDHHQINCQFNDTILPLPLRKTGK